MSATTFPITIDRPDLREITRIDIDPLPGGLFGLSVEVDRRFHVRQLAETEISRDALRRMRARIDELLEDRT